jgi:hypothetical protein
MIGKPYSEKPSVRFNEGELEIEPFGNYATLYSAVTNKQNRTCFDVACQVKYRSGHGERD